jgi:phage tail-like protein
MSSRRVIYGLVAISLLVAASIGLIASPISSGAGAVSSDPITAARFAIVVNGQQLAAFSELQALTSGYETEDIDVDQKETILTVPSKHRPPSIILKRGLTSDRALWDWHADAIQNGSRAWRDAELVMYDYEGRPVARFNMINAWPSKLEVDTLSSGGQAVAMETLTLVCERIERVSA